MINFIPGKIVKTFKTKKKKEVVIRYPKWEDIDEITACINKLSKENTFITFSGEIITKEEEIKAVAGWFSQMEIKDKVVLVGEIDKKIIAIANVDRNKNNRKRSLHVGKFGIAVLKEYRGEGIGIELTKTVISEAKKKISGLKLIILDVYEINSVAKKMYEKLGFKYGGEIPKAILYKENYVSDVKMYLEL